MANRKLGVLSAHRSSMLKNLASELIMNGRLETTETRAKEVRKVVEKMITLGKRGDIHARRQAVAQLHMKENEAGQDTIQVLFSEVAPRYVDRQGGYTRIMKTGPRRGDGAPMAIIELV
ncbi:MAG: ribosomal protein [Bacillales bacterium]|jgi:large subunit ribosomal protein L17|nr:ribosomal protein [Bacillales bacterium]